MPSEFYLNFENRFDRPGLRVLTWPHPHHPITSHAQYYQHRPLGPIWPMTCSKSRFSSHHSYPPLSFLNVVSYHHIAYYCNTMIVHKLVTWDAIANYVMPSSHTIQTNLADPNWIRTIKFEKPRIEMTLPPDLNLDSLIDSSYSTHLCMAITCWIHLPLLCDF